MVTERMTLSRFLAAQAQSHGDASGELSAIVLDVATACRQIAETVRAGALGKSTEHAPTYNSQGERQAPLDVVANDIFVRANETSGRVAAMVSEEMEAPLAVGADGGKAKIPAGFRSARRIVEHRRQRRRSAASFPYCAPRRRKTSI